MKKITLELPDDEAMALAQLCKRFRWDIAKDLSRPDDGGRERDAMLEGVMSLQRVLAEAGFAPR
jgi:hypothetical protein